MERERKYFYKKLTSYCIFFNNKKCFPLHVCKVFLPNLDACLILTSSPAHGLKFWGARAQVACVILAHTASRMKFHGYFESTSTKQYSTKFLKSKGFISQQIPIYGGYIRL